jgi:argininosuccinate lyase
MLPILCLYDPLTNTITGVPFRETHHLAGRMVALAEDEKKGMDELTVTQFQGVDKVCSFLFIFQDETANKIAEIW